MQGDQSTGFNSAVGLLDQMDRCMPPQQQGQAVELTWRRSCDHVGFEPAEMEVKIYGN